LAHSGIAIDRVGAAYVFGGTTSTNFPVTADAFQHTFGGSGVAGFTGTGDGFVAKLNPRGSALVYSTYLGGSAFDLIIAGSVDRDGNAYVTGSTSSANFPSTPGSARSQKAASKVDVFVVKMPTPKVLRSTSTSVSCSPGKVSTSSATSCTATISDTDGGPASPPSGSVVFTNSQRGAFGHGAKCTLNDAGSAGGASCHVSYAPAGVQSGTQTISASYGGDAVHAPSTGKQSVRVTVAPAITRAGLTNNPFLVGSRPTRIFGRAARARRHRIGTTFIYTLSRAARVRITIAARGAGRREGRRCVGPTRRLRRAKRCVRVIAIGTLTRISHRGANRVAFSGRIGRRSLRPGRYQATLVAVNGAGNRSKPRTIKFTIARR